MNATASRIVLTFALSLTFCFLRTQRLDAYVVPAGFATCQSLEACLSNLDPVASGANGSIGPDEEAFARKLATFGDPAKHELLRRAAGSDIKWRNLSQAILENWKSWSPSDVPELRAALRQNPGGWMARPLMTIGTPAAIDALVEDLPKGSENQTDFAFEKLGARAVSALMPLFENENTISAATRAIKLMGDAAAPFQSEWSQIANDPGRPLVQRLAALRAINALGNNARPSAPSIQALASSPQAELREQAALTLEAIQSFEQKADSNAEGISIIELLANPLKYDGKHVRITGFLRLEFEGNAIYLHREDYEHALFENSFWVGRPRDFTEKQASEVDRKYVICEGTFSAKQHGHMGMFGGSLTHITRLESWEPAARRD